MSESKELTGKVHHIGELQTFASGFSKREIVIETEGDFSQMIPLEFHKEKTKMIDGLAVGQKATVSYNMRGREYNGRYFLNLVGWKILKGESAPDVVSTVQAVMGGAVEEEEMVF
jgi:hypothetical protein